MDSYYVDVERRSEGTTLAVVPMQNPDGIGAHGALAAGQERDFDFDVALVGLGYVGLPTALSFHAAGSSVLGVDVSARRREDIARCRVDLLGSDHERLRTALQDRGAFTVTGEVAELTRSRAVIIAVPTPVDGHLLPDLSILRDACAQVVENAVPGQVLILTSTTYVGSTSDLLVTPLRNRGFSVGEDIHVAFSPERIDPGNDRHRHEDVPRVVGGVTPACADAARAALGAYAENLHVVSSPAAAEMTKLFENTFRAVNIALANEISEVSRTLKLDAIEVIEAAATKPYGFMPFFPGPGVGGHCIPCDPHYLLWQLRAARQDAPVITSAMTAIALRPNFVHQRALELLAETGKPLRGARILVLGVTYKPNIADVRESPALDIIESLSQAGAQVDFHDPLVSTVAMRGATLTSVSGSDAGGYDLVIAHSLHSRLDPAWLDAAPLVLDTTFRLAHPKAVAL